MTFSTIACPHCGHANLPDTNQCMKCHAALFHAEGDVQAPVRGPLPWLMAGIVFVAISGFLYSAQNQPAVSAPRFFTAVASEAPPPPEEAQETVALPSIAQNPDAPGASTSVAGSWHPVAQFHGDAPQRTAPFTIRARYWRIQWTAASTSSRRGARNWFYAFVYRNRGTLVGKLDGALSPNGGNVSLQNRGIYYINVNANQRWDLTVEEWW